ncbi:MAG: cytochrome C [Crocinitomicaceae bacterium]|nr:cytochrome C [Crocinitomicaceae bacterium]
MDELKGPTGENQCLSCHGGIEPIRSYESEMMKEILKVAEKASFKGNDCIVCHGGNPTSKDKKIAHKGTVDYFINHQGPKEFYPDPGSPWINQNTCGGCHEAQVKPQFTSLMFTEAGKIQGTQWGFGAPNGYKHDWANFDVEELPLHEQLGTEIHKAYMQKLKEIEPNVFPSKMKQLPLAPDADQVMKDPQKAVFTYIRQECQRCHTGGQGSMRKGEFRGIGCSSCHVPYSTQGYYEGNDLSISRTEPGHPLVHSFQSTRECKVNVHGKEYSGIPSRTCVTCHNRGRRIGTSYMGLFETAYSAPFMGGGEEQEETFGKKYIQLHADIHKDKGMMCQDCHTSGDVHSSGILAGSTLGAVEIECQDCHGTPQKFPWELPIGYSDEIDGVVPAEGKARGVTKDLLEHFKQGTVVEPKDGYLISARGNPLPQLVKNGDQVILHSAGGKDIEFSPLKKLLEDNELSEEGIVAMVNVDGHIDNMECYACHDDWAPQCYGCHIKIDYSKNMTKEDWVSMGLAHDEAGITAEMRGENDQHQIDGLVSEERSYLRFEDPPLAVNGENRIAPSIPGCQTSITIIGKDSVPLLLNHIYRISNSEGAGEEGQKALDMAVTHTHTVSKKGRSCESCHNNPKAMGYGIQSGELLADPSKGYTIDLQDAEGNAIADCTINQIGAIPELDHDWSRFITETSEQLQTVGHHFKGSRPLNKEERGKLDRRGVCQGCHQEIPDKDLAVSLLVHMKEYSGQKVDTNFHNFMLNKILLLSAWMQVLIGAILTLTLFLVVRKIRAQRKN